MNECRWQACRFNPYKTESNQKKVARIIQFYSSSYKLNFFLDTKEYTLPIAGPSLSVGIIALVPFKKQGFLAKNSVL